MPKTNREVSALSKEIGAWVMARRESSEPPISRPILAKKVEQYLGAPVYKVMIQRIEEGTREVTAAEAKALALAFGLPPDALMNPATVGDAQLMVLRDRAWKARESYWKACAELYEVGRAYGDMFAQAFTPERMRAVENAFVQAFDLEPPSSRVSPAISEKVASTARVMAVAGKAHQADVLELKRTAARQKANAADLRRQLAKERAAGVPDEDLEVIYDVIEMTEAEEAKAGAKEKSLESYTRPTTERKNQR